MSDELARLDAVGQAELVRSGEISPSELLDATLARIDALDPELNAVIHRMDDKAGAAAASPDLPDGPFRGVPMLIKDLWPASAGDPFHMGIKAFAEAGYRHPTDAHLVTRYRQAGFVVAGRTNTPELGLMATTEPLAYGPTHNPWDTTRSPGGSSGGAAAAVAAGMVPMANASDGGGSIRIPAAMCGLVGLKPSRGRVSMGPLQDEWGVSTQHIVSHTVRDTAAVLDVSWAPFHGDGVIAPAIGQPYADQVGADPGSLRIGVLTEARGGVETHPECLQAVADAVALLERLGHRVSDDSPAALDDPEVRLAFGVLWGVSARANLVALGRMLGRELGPDDVEPGTWAMVEQAEGVGGVDVLVAQGAQHRFRRAVQAWWNDFDLLLTPTTARPPAPLGQMVATAEDPMRGLVESIPYAAFTSPFNITGQPGISLPLHMTADDLPVGVQLVAAYGREDLLIRVAAQLESEVRWADRRAPMHP